MPPRGHFLSFALALLLCGGLPAQSLANQVNVMVGTAADGQTYPSVAAPFAMTQWTPQTRKGEAKCVAPYYYADTHIQGFRGSHFISGSCAQDYGSFTLMPLPDATRLDAEARASAFSHASEQAHPYLYAVDLADSGIHAEITGLERSGMMRFRYPPGQRTGWLAVEDNLRLGKGTLHIDASRREITGENPVHRIYNGAGESAGFSGYIVVQFDRSFQVGGTWSGKTRRDGAVEQTGEGADAAPGAFVSFTLPLNETVQIRIGTSFTSIEEARRNLAVEIPAWKFDAVAVRARAAWEAALSKVEIQGDSPDRRIFYTALYHTLQLPRIYSDRDGSYPRFGGGLAAAGKVEHATDFTYYCDYSAWDTFRALHPMLTILDPARDRDMVKSLIAKGEQGGFLPIFPAWNSYTSEMIGDHTAAIITDAWMKGIRGFDGEAAYRLMRRNATEGPATEAMYRDGRGRRSLASYLKYGYIPLEDRVPYAFHGDEQVSRTLEYAFDDFEVATLARALGHTTDAAFFTERSQNYRKVLDPETGFARGRHADGSWVNPFDPTVHASYITEGLAYQYTFFVPQDIPGLIALLHGAKAFVKKLDGLFDGGFYDHGNEPSHHIAYLYNAAGVPYKTQFHVHEIMSRQYRDAIDGLAGNDDAGQISAWYVMSALGLYAVTPGLPQYAIGTPHFDDITLHLPNGRSLHIVARGAEAGRYYVSALHFNGHRVSRTHILHSEIIGGGELVFSMSNQPNQ